MTAIPDTRFQDMFACLEVFEIGLNVVGYIPIVGTFSGAIREKYAAIEGIVGIVLAILGIGLQMQNAPNSSLYLRVGVILVAHSILNAIRGLIELVPTLPLVTTLPYDLIATIFVGHRLFSYIHD